MRSTLGGVRRLIVGLVAIGGLGALAACTRTPVPVEVEGWINPTSRAAGPASAATREPVDPDPGDFAVVWVPAGEVLPVREVAGLSGPEVGRLRHDQKGIRLTGSRTALGSSTWVEIRARSDVVGWVRFWSLTEQVPAEGFCRDDRVDGLVNGLEAALAASDGAALRELLSPKRELILRFDYWNPETRIAQASVAGIFETPQSYEWGTRFAGGAPVEGSFSEVVQPSLLDVFGQEYDRACNQILAGSGVGAAEWPAEYTNLNYMSFHRPAPSGGNEFNWRTWVAGFEYIEGEPLLALLLQIRPPF